MGNLTNYYFHCYNAITITVKLMRYKLKLLSEVVVI